MNIRNGSSTSEFRLSAALTSVLTVLYTVFMALVAGHTIQVPESVTDVTTAVYGLVTGGVAVNYSRNRKDVKISLVNAQTHAELLGTQLSSSLPIFPATTDDPAGILSPAAPSEAAAAQ